MSYQLERFSFTKKFSSDERLAIKTSSFRLLKHLYLVVMCIDLDILLLIFRVKHTGKWSLIDR